MRDQMVVVAGFGRMVWTDGAQYRGDWTEDLPGGRGEYR